ncbi:60S ribosomal protein L24 [Canna indica]|uniref:60S ribosomal protein L24 n=1 Tax=Canna indica TaxID=4628 RepID=A0AAQ3KSV4_9LILI|nr:60S ribosomal protein L24 [Canna indica]
MNEHKPSLEVDGEHAPQEHRRRGFRRWIRIYKPQQAQVGNMREGGEAPKGVPTQIIILRETELCRFSGAKIYPGKGIRFIRSDSQVFLFANSKCKRYFHNRLKPAKLTWTAMYRKQHKKDIHAEAVKKRRRATKKPYSRSIVGATLEVIQKKRTEKPEVRDAAREAALREIKERIKKTKDEKKAKKAESMSKTQKSQSKGGMPKAAKGPKIGGGGGKR